MTNAGYLQLLRRALPMRLCFFVWKRTCICFFPNDAEICALTTQLVNGQNKLAFGKGLKKYDVWARPPQDFLEIPSKSVFICYNGRTQNEGYLR